MWERVLALHFLRAARVRVRVRGENGGRALNAKYYEADRSKWGRRVRVVVENEMSGCGCCTVDADSYFLEPRKSQRLYNHSDAFEWGYGGSGPAQLALAILLDFFSDSNFKPETVENAAVKIHHKFKLEFLTRAPSEGFKIKTEEIEEWLKKSFGMVTA